jgi:hypothetical protein
MNRKLLLIALLALGATAVTHAANENITVYKDPDCGCCTAWIDHLRENGYKVRAVNTSDMDAIKKKYAVPTTLGSCHTAVIDKSGQVLEGHVPANAVRKLIAQPKVKGLAVPGMPVNSPGMGKMDGPLLTVDFSGKPFSKD